jgi:hypothetical protein
MPRTILLAIFGLAWTAIAFADPIPVPDTTPSLQPIAHWAIPANNDHYVGYYVGGGCSCPRLAEGRARDEGTWGWDYRGWLIPRDIIHGWWHGRRYQGGSGAYRTDGVHH